MKLLLTSVGIRDKALADALLGLAQAPVSKLNLVFIPTAASIRDEDKQWLIDDMASFKNLGCAKIDIVELAALTREQVLPRLEQADILVFGGGSTQYLLACVQDKLHDDLAALLQTRILVGISAGGVMCCPVINPAGAPGLGYVDFLFIPHMGSAFASRTKEDIQGFASMAGRIAYWADDNAGVLVAGDEVRLVGSGSVEIIEP